MTVDINKLNKDELKNLLKDLKLLKSLKKDLGKRGTKLFDSIKSGTPIYKIEKDANISDNTALEKALEVYTKLMGDKPAKESIEIITRENLKGGIRIYKNDNMIDMSFLKVENLLKD